MLKPFSLRTLCWAWLAACALLAITYFITARWSIEAHAQGNHSSPVAAFNQYVVAVSLGPHLVASKLFRAMGNTHMSRAAYLAQGVVGALILFAGLAGAGLGALLLGNAASRTWRGPKAGRPGSAVSAEISNEVAGARAPLRRDFLARFAAGGALLAAPSGAGAALHRLVGNSRRIQWNTLHFPLVEARSPVARWVIVHLTDVHFGPSVSDADMRRLVGRINSLQPDLILLTGDYILDNRRYIAPAAAHLGRLRARLGVFGVLGNHDWYEDGPACRDALSGQGIQMIDNSRSFVSERGVAAQPFTDLPDSHQLCIAGVGDLWEDEVDLGVALGGVPAAVPTLLLSHNPDLVLAQEARNPPRRPDLVLSGHTHGGQVCLPKVGPLTVPSKYGRRFAQGLCEGPDQLAPVFVNRGTRTSFAPMRLLATPEVVVVRLGHSAALAGAGAARFSARAF